MHDDREPSSEGPGKPGVSARRNRFAAADARSQRILMLVLRAVFVVLLISVVVLTVASNRREGLDFGFSTVVGLLMASAALGLIIITVDALTPNKRLAWVVGIFVGTMLGLVGAVAVGSVIDLVANSWELKESSAVYLGLAKVTIGLVLVYLSVSVVLTTRDDFRVVIPYLEFARQVRGTRPLLLDTSVLVDGRIEDLGRTGIVDAPVIVPAFVIDELQALADSGDAGKRQRGRRGLDVLQRLQANPFLDVEIEEFRAEGRSTDRALVEVARDERFRVVTLDSGLEKVAQINGVPVLNLAAVSAAMRPGQASGDGMRIELVKRGEAPHQGVGFLEDGTMVVVDHGAGRVGSSVDVVVN
ncbi:MAG: PIN domain-containing protein, partial [Phycisphaerales bacterium]